MENPIRDGLTSDILSHAEDICRFSPIADLAALASLFTYLNTGYGLTEACAFHLGLEIDDSPDLTGLTGLTKQRKTAALRKVAA